jgi:hypothetical protein
LAEEEREVNVVWDVGEESAWCGADDVGEREGGDVVGWYVAQFVNEKGGEVSSFFGGKVEIVGRWLGRGVWHGEGWCVVTSG